MVYINDVDIIKRCQQGDEEAFSQLVKRYQEKVVWIAYQMIGNYEEARDISQEAFIRVYRSISQFNLMSNFYTWLYRIVVNLCIDHLRKQKPINRALSFDDIGEISANSISADRILEQQELSQDVHNILQELPVPYRTILLLRDIEGFSCKEIGKIVGCNSNTVRWRLFRARQIFKELWEKQMAKRNKKQEEDEE
jgi:RNA polymerase sigma-70 factor (ECF subfamily)